MAIAGFRFALLTAAIFAIVGCESTPDVRADYDKAADFGKYRTFGFVTNPNTAKSLGLQTLQQAATREMQARGYTRSDDNPDLLINFQGKIEEKTDIESTPAPMYGGGWGYRGWYGAPYGGYGVGYGSEVSTRHYKVGHLVMDVVDRQRQQVVFQAGTEGTLTKEMRENMTATLNQAVTNLFAKYPFTAGQSAAQPVPGG